MTSLCKCQPTTMMKAWTGRCGCCPPALLTSWSRIDIYTNFQTRKCQSCLKVLPGACQQSSREMRVQMVGASFCTLLQRNTMPVGMCALVSFTRLWMCKTEFIEYSCCCFLNIVASSVRRKASKQATRTLGSIVFIGSCSHQESGRQKKGEIQIRCWVGPTASCLKSPKRGLTI